MCVRHGVNRYDILQMEACMLLPAKMGLCEYGMAWRHTVCVLLLVPMDQQRPLVQLLPKTRGTCVSKLANSAVNFIKEKCSAFSCHSLLGGFGHLVLQRLLSRGLLELRNPHISYGSGHLQKQTKFLNTSYMYGWQNWLAGLGRGHCMGLDWTQWQTERLSSLIPGPG